MRVLLFLGIALVPAIAQTPFVHLTNTTRPAGSDLQIGDRYEIVIAGPPNQPVSVRTTRQGRTDWGPVVGSTDSRGRWSTAGQFEARDFGDWTEVWTVGGKLATPALHFFIGAPCLKDGQAWSGKRFVTCETTGGTQTFVTPSDSDAFRTPDGRVIPGRLQSDVTPDQYRAEILQYFITASRRSDQEASPVSLQSSRGGLGDETGGLIAKLIGVNALNEDETRNLLSMVHAAFEKPETIPQSAKDPSRTLLLLRSLEAATEQEALKQQIAATIAYVQTR